MHLLFSCSNDGNVAASNKVWLIKNKGDGMVGKHKDVTNCMALQCTINMFMFGYLKIPFLLLAYMEKLEICYF